MWSRAIGASRERSGDEGERMRCASLRSPDFFPPSPGACLQANFKSTFILISFCDLKWLDLRNSKKKAINTR